MKHSLFKKLIISGLVTAMLAGACGCDFFVSPSELFVTPGVSPTVTPHLTVIPGDPNADPTVVPVTPGQSDVEPTSPATGVPSPTTVPSATPSPVPTVPPAPAELNRDPSTYDFLVNRAVLLSDNYAPNDLVPLSECALDYDNLSDDKHKLRKVAAEALTDMFNAAKTEGLTLVAVSGYRSFERQYQIYGNYLLTYSLSHTNRYSAVPGSSEHQTGLAMDVSCSTIDNKLIDEFYDTPEGKWMYEHCWEYGFIIRYPKGKTEITGYAYEPWHVRYVGIPLAYYLTTTGLTLDEYYASCDPYDDAYLNTHPLIDTNTLKYHKLYASAKYGKLIMLPDGNAWINPATSYPYLIPALRDAKKNIVKDSKKNYIYSQPLTNCFGEYFFDESGNLMMKPVYSDEKGNPILNSKGEAFFLEPLVEGNGNFVRDYDGNIVYRDLLLDSKGQVWVNPDGTPEQLVPLRDDSTYLVYDDFGKLMYYTPYEDFMHYGEGGTSDYRVDANGNPQYSAWFYNALDIEKSIAVIESGVTPSNGFREE